MRKQIGALAGIITILSSCGGGGSDAGGNVSTVPPSAPTPAPPPPPTSTAGCSVTERQNWVAGEMDTYYLFPELLPANRSPSGYSTVPDYINYLTATARAQGKDRYFTYITSIEEENAYYRSGTNAGIGVRLGLTSDNRLFVTESFERIHRSNLVGMGVLPFEFINGENRRSLKIRGDEKFTIEGINLIQPNKIVECKIIEKENIRKINLLTRIDTLKELEYYKAGGILQYVLNSIINKTT